MQIILSVSIAVLAGLLMTRVVKSLKLPDVTAYLILSYCRSNKLGSKHKNKSRKFPSTYFYRALYRPVCPIGHIVYL